MVNQISDKNINADSAKAEDFIMTFSHDLKNPLTAVIGSIDIIRAGLLGPVNEEQEEYLQSAIDSCNEVVIMLDNVINIKKFEAGKNKLSICHHNTNELINKTMPQFTRQAAHDGIRFLVTLDPGVPDILVDSLAFSRVLENLLNNVLKSTAEGCAITVSCCHIPEGDLHNLKTPVYAQIPPYFPGRNGCVKITIKASGTGIPADELAHIFDCHSPFTRKTEQSRKDAGLGLVYCKLATDSFRGAIWAESATEEEIAFVTLLPCR